MDAQIAFYSIVLNWTFDQSAEETEPFRIQTKSHRAQPITPITKDETERKSNALHHCLHSRSGGSVLEHDDSSGGPAHKKRKLNNGTSIPSPNGGHVPPPLEGLDESSPTSKLSQFHITSPRKRPTKQHLKIPKGESPTPNPSDTDHPTNFDADDSQKRKRFKRAVTLKSNKAKTQQQEQRDQALYDELFPVEKFKKITKFHRNQQKADQLSKICTFPNTAKYMEHFASLLFDDLRARLEGKIQDELRRGWAREMLPAAILREVGHKEYICCSFQILSKSSRWMKLVNTKTVVLIVYDLPDPDWKFTNFKSLPRTHVMAIADEPPTHSHIKLQIHLTEDDERYKSFIDCFKDNNHPQNGDGNGMNGSKQSFNEQKSNHHSNDSNPNINNDSKRSSRSRERKRMKIVFLENIQNRMREFRAICNADKLRLKNIIMDPQSVLLQQQFCAQKPEYTIGGVSTSSDSKSTAYPDPAAIPNTNNTNPSSTLNDGTSGKQLKSQDESLGESRVWHYVPDNYKTRLGRYLNTSQCRAIEKACQHKGVTLLQGPPGTGKTRTVLHLMNAFHLSKIQAQFQSWLQGMHQRFRRQIEREMRRKQQQTVDLTGNGTTNVNQQPLGNGMNFGDSSYNLGDIIRDVSQNSFSRKVHDECTVVSRPRILVAAPSNAAVDEIISRLMEQQFVDGNDINYKPPIIRIGNMEKCREAVGKFVSLESRVEAFLKHRWNQREPERVSLEKLNKRIGFFKAKKKEYEQKLCRHVQLNLRTFGKMDFDEFQRTATQQIIELLQAIDTNGRELLRLKWVRNLPRRKARDKLIMSVLLESELIFTTLNSAGGRELRLLLDELMATKSSDDINSRLFDHCVIDEAGQCTEPDILIPLIYDIDSVVLVGDPQQLPATVFAQGPSAWLYERSLFERLMTAGHPVHLLDTQYRMHPEIAFFPNKHFYEEKLKNGDHVLGPKYMKLFHSESSKFAPFLFFNLASSESRNGHSLYNLDEAQFIIQQLRAFYMHCMAEAKEMSIGIITPYRQQREKIKDLLNAAPDLQAHLNKIEVATVDFYQGREKDVILFSCVRANGRGIGFLSDIRRMNVAITRAKYSLWIVGNETSLQRNPDWGLLAQHAKDRKCMRWLRYQRNTRKYELCAANQWGRDNGFNNHSGRGRGNHGSRGRERGRGRGRGGRGRGRDSRDRGRGRGRGRGRRDSENRGGFGRGRGRGRGRHNHNGPDGRRAPVVVLQGTMPQQEVIDYGNLNAPIHGIHGNQQPQQNRPHPSNALADPFHGRHGPTPSSHQQPPHHLSSLHHPPIQHPNPQHHPYPPHHPNGHPPPQMYHPPHGPSPSQHISGHRPPGMQQPTIHVINGPPPDMVTKQPPTRNGIIDFTKTALHSSAFDE